ncbi:MULTISPECIES: DUF5993 family protein [unclassified Methylobacterium]|uniref:DUF5993 family protein n=1 Tax=unclassified Methylobacterium TaxID=2615210 RepID=UPI0019106091|nr:MULTISPECIES: DUF5993 family protein [unclassified Methylobacterium]MCK2052598.1 hypothetical protein [Methylobacterium sp. 37f]
MMVIPFLGVSGALAAALVGRRSLALGLWGVSLIALLLLFRQHASDALNLTF